MIIRRFVFVTVAVLVGIATSQEQTTLGDFVVFTNKSSYLSSTGAVDATGALPTTGFIGQQFGSPPGPITTVGSINFQAVRYIFSEFSIRLPGSELGISDGADGGGVNENLNIISLSPVLAMGFDFVEPQNDPNVNTTFVDSTFTVSVKNGSTLLHSFTFNAPNDTAAFVGVAGDVAFDRLEIRETIGTDDNEFYGHVYTLIAPVPEPSSMIMVAVGLVSFGAIRAGRSREHRCQLPI